jgi:1-acyl-sn-glycerol-3-phosphate acyltransferase
VIAVPALPAGVPRRGNAVMRSVGRAVLTAMGWRIEGAMPELGKFVIAVAPHTSNWDFVVGASAMFALDIRLSFIGKHTLFVGPFAAMMRWMGGIPVDRSKPHGVVGDSVSAFEHANALVLAIAPEGTRKPVPRFKTGFLAIARGARVPIVLAALDWGTRTVRLGPLFVPGEDVEADRAEVEAHFKAIRGRNR